MSSTDSPLSFCGPGTLSVSLMTVSSSFLSRSTYVLDLHQVQHAELLVPHLMRVLQAPMIYKQEKRLQHWRHLCRTLQNNHRLVCTLSSCIHIVARLFPMRCRNHFRLLETIWMHWYSCHKLCSSDFPTEALYISVIRKWVWKIRQKCIENHYTQHDTSIEMCYFAVITV